ncbi:hypothetical protein [Cognatishimia maritima]|uniref:Uncharacterized protein n=1 Tax=Cognatishimia maritima TaxID=870908 RepID=A0A1M5K7H4_9RHOB|nr:hypothetical protein [Cognatishimia maritima]SHG48745.1 hypothetical protein SAMN04488044_0891 [Cognatishimia maritima]
MWSNTPKIAVKLRRICGAVLLLLLATQTSVFAGELDGKVFKGLIGPSANPDLEDSLHFSDGHFWSDICTRCGFQPGPYQSKTTEEGTTFQGVLQSDSRGQFTYDGLIHPNGSIDVTIKWERKRWYWTTRREIAFRGQLQDAQPASALKETLAAMHRQNPNENPLCARF